MMALGIDIGNGYVKFNTEKFASRVKVGESINFGKAKKEVHAVEFEGVKYIVGEGTIFTGDNRYFTKEYKICLLTAIALASGNEDFVEENIVIGLPEKKHKLIGSVLKQHIEGFGQQNIIVDSKAYTIRINSCIIFIESAYPILIEDENNVLMIDVGAGTINVTQWESLSILNSATYTESMFKMYAEVASYLNSTKGADLNPIDIEKILNKKTITINQKEVDISDIRNIIDNHITEISAYIRNEFKVKSADKICLIGGGGADTYNYWKKQFESIQLVQDSQYINCKVYDAIAKEEWKIEKKTSSL